MTQPVIEGLSASGARSYTTTCGSGPLLPVHRRGNGGALQHAKLLTTGPR